jgi:hypothetical protein
VHAGPTQQSALKQAIQVTTRQFAGQDFYWAQHYAASFIFELMGTR